MSKTVKIVIGVILIVISGNGLLGLTMDPNLTGAASGAYKSGYLFGYLAPTIIFLGIGIYLIYSATKSNKSLSIIESADERTKIGEKQKESE